MFLFIYQYIDRQELLSCFHPTTINPLRAKYCIWNMMIYLQFISFHYTEMTWAVEMLPRVRQELTYSA